MYNKPFYVFHRPRNTLAVFGVDPRQVLIHNFFEGFLNLAMVIKAFTRDLQLVHTVYPIIVYHQCIYYVFQSNLDVEENGEEMISSCDSSRINFSVLWHKTELALNYFLCRPFSHRWQPHFRFKDKQGQNPFAQFPTLLRSQLSTASDSAPLLTCYHSVLCNQSIFPSRHWQHLEWVVHYNGT